MKFEPEDCVGTTCSVPITGGCRVRAERKDADGNPKHLEREGTFFGYVDVTYPEGAKDVTPFESVYDVVERGWWLRNPNWSWARNQNARPMGTLD